MGGVILNIDYSLTEKAFSKLTSLNFDEIYGQHKQGKIFDLYETGKIPSDEFRQHLNKLLQIDVDNNMFDLAWNAMLLELPMEKISALKRISKQKNIYLLSNTNDIHYQFFKHYIDHVYSFEKFEKIFKRTYYSHLLGLRKPNPKAFQHILDENNLNPAETLFIDDTKGHLEGAKACGIHTHFLPSNDRLSFI